MKKIFTALIFTLFIGYSFAFFWGKSCEDGNTDKCFREINELKKEYSKKETNALKRQVEIDNINEQIKKLEERRSVVEMEKETIETILSDIKKDADTKRSILQSLGF